MINYQQTLNDESSVISVSEINSKIKLLLEGDFNLVWIQGEISNFKPHSSGHHYFSLKDKKSQIAAVMFRGFNQRLKFQPENGMEVIVRARVTVYEPRGSYQLLCEQMEPMGAGALQKAFEQLKKKLSSEGLFDSNKKKKIPLFPKTIALVTSPTGAAVRDMLNVLQRRYPIVNVVIVPCLVQGKTAANSIIDALMRVDKLSHIDTIIVGRGGGSIEDLWSFNEEAVVRTIANLNKPVISAVGHEVDFTISDFVADKRAPTPSAAAEIAVPNQINLTEKIQSQHAYLVKLISKIMNQKQEKIFYLQKRLVDPKKRLVDLNLRLDELLFRLEYSVKRHFKNERHKLWLLRKSLRSPDYLLRQKKIQLDNLEKRHLQLLFLLLNNKKELVKKWASLLDSFSPLKVLERGYSVVFNHNKNVVKEAKNLKINDPVRVKLYQGEFIANIEKIIS